jgi:hypothetical protein
MRPFCIHRIFFGFFLVLEAMIQEEVRRFLSESQFSCVTAAAVITAPATGAGCRMDLPHQTRFRLLSAIVC